VVAGNGNTEKGESREWERIDRNSAIPVQRVQIEETKVWRHPTKTPQIGHQPEANPDKKKLQTKPESPSSP